MKKTLGFAGLFTVAILIVTLFILVFCGCSREPAWKKANDELKAAHGITLETRSLPDTDIESLAGEGLSASLNDAPVIEIAEGVSAKVVWTRGIMTAVVSMKAGAEIPRENLGASERIMLMREGAVEQLVRGAFVPMKAFVKTTNWSATPHNDFIYLPEQADNAVKAGPNGASFLEVYSPPRHDYIEKAGGTLAETPQPLNSSTEAVTQAETVQNFHDLQFFEMRSPAMKARLIGGKNMQLMFKSADPGYSSNYHGRVEDRFSLILRGGSQDDNPLGSVSLETDSYVYLPSGMVHRENAGPKGYDMLTIVWPPNPEFNNRLRQRMSAFNAIIPEGEQVTLVHDGETAKPTLNFTEGPAWMNGSLYFSNMWFEKGFASGSPEESNTIRIAPDGTLHIVKKGLQTNGLMSLGNGKLAVCDMFGHRVIEMSGTGRVIRTFATEFDGVRLDGPNDLVIDAKGGIYFTDPQFTPGLDKTQPGRSVFYRRPDGEIIRVIEPETITLPNGILLSPDGTTCYINDTRGDIVFAFDVNGDGSLSNRRDFAKLMVPPGQRDNEATVTGADGMTIDTQGNIYVATIMGLQIFDSDGGFVGIVHFPIRPVSACFGGNDMKTIYATCNTQIYKIRTNVTGLTYPLKN